MQILRIKLKKPIANLYRKETVLLLVVSNNRLLLATKKSYPPNLFRFLGGGVELGEAPREAAKRELKEELRLDSKGEVKLRLLDSIKIIAETNDGIFEHIITGFLYNSPGIINAYDKQELSELRWIDLKQVKKYFRSISGITGKFENEKITFYWEDFVRLYISVQEIFIDCYKKNTQECIKYI